MAVGQRQRLYSGARMFTGNYLSSPPQIPRIPGVELELSSLMSVTLIRSRPPALLHYFYNHAHHLRLEKLLYIELSRSPNRFFKPLLDPGDGFTSETAERRFQK
jgi:hypothetical protein